MNVDYRKQFSGFIMYVDNSRVGMYYPQTDEMVFNMEYPNDLKKVVNETTNVLRYNYLKYWMNICRQDKNYKRQTKEKYIGNCGKCPERSGCELSKLMKQVINKLPTI